MRILGWPPLLSSGSKTWLQLPQRTEDAERACLQREIWFPGDSMRTKGIVFVEIRCCRKVCLLFMPTFYLFVVSPCKHQCDTITPPPVMPKKRNPIRLDCASFPESARYRQGPCPGYNPQKFSGTFLWRGAGKRSISKLVVFSMLFMYTCCTCGTNSGGVCQGGGTRPLLPRNRWGSSHTLDPRANQHHIDQCVSD